MTHAINRVFPVLILTGYSVLFSAFALAAENNSQQSEKTASGNYDSDSKTSGGKEAGTSSGNRCTHKKRQRYF